jgi:hypothetical protein
MKEELAKFLKWMSDELIFRYALTYDDCLKIAEEYLRSKQTNTEGQP